MNPSEAQPAIHVLAGVLVDGQGRVLLAQRPPGKHLAGAWEFPGGKREPGEAPIAALARELHEELGILLQGAEPLIRIPWRYGDRRLLLDAWRVHAWDGEPQALDAQALRWEHPGDVDIRGLAPADRPILQAVFLPERYVITPADWPVERFDHIRGHIVDALSRGERLIQLRLPSWSFGQVRELARSLLDDVRAIGAQLVLNSDIEGALKLGLGVGVHLTSTLLRATHGRPLPPDQLVAASCHSESELDLAATCGVDVATLAPVQHTASHPDATPLGWDTFQHLVERSPFPVYALGGMQHGHAAQARACGAQGVAGIRGFWPD